MKIKDVIYKTPEMSEEKLLEMIDKNKIFLKRDLVNRLCEIHGYDNIKQSILDEWDLIQDKKSLLTKGQRDQICSLVSVSLIQMTKDDGRDSTVSNNGDSIENIQEAEEIRND